MAYDDRNGQHLNGIYRAHPVESEAIMCKASTGTPQVAVEFELLNEGFVGDRITWYGFLTDAAIKNAVKGLRNCGWVGTKWDETIIIDTNAEVDLDITPDTYNGKTISKVQWVNKPGESGSGPKPMDAAKRKAFAARMNGLLMRDAPKSAPDPTKPRTKRPPTAPPVSAGGTAQALGLVDSEIPF